MKSRLSKIFLTIAIFISLFATVYIFLRPTYASLGKKIESSMESLRANFEEKTGLTFSYSSLSPSILTGIYLKGIELKDFETGEKIATINTAELKYSLFDLIKGDYLEALKKIVLHDVDIELVEGKNDFWIKKISSSNKTDEVVTNETRKFDIEALEQLKIKIPCDIFIYRLKVAYRNKNLYAAGNFVDTEIETVANSTNINASLNGELKLSLNNQNVSTKIDCAVTVVENLNNSAAVINLRDIFYKDYFVNNLSFICEYEKRLLSFRTLPDENSIYLEAVADFESSDLSARVIVDNFAPTNLVHTKVPSENFNKLKETSFSINASVKYNLVSQKIQYNTSGNIGLSKELVPGGVVASYSLNGDANKINISSLSVLGERYDVSLSGDYNFNTKRPTGIVSVNKFEVSNGRVISTEVFIESSQDGIVCFSPQTMFDDKAFTATQLNITPKNDIWEFEFETSDFSHADENESSVGVLNLYGTYQTTTKELQLSAGLNNFYLDSIILTGAFFANKDSYPVLQFIASYYNDTICTGEFFGSAIDKTFSFNMPYAIIANTENESQMLIFSVDGNNDSLQLNRFEYLNNGQRINLIAQIERLAEESSMALSARLDVNDLPYNISGIISNGLVSITGDYGLGFSLNPETPELTTGSFAITNFPIKLNDVISAISIDTTYTYTKADGLNIVFNNFESQELIQQGSISPRFSFSGNMDSGGLHLQNVVFADSVSTLSGKADVFWNISDGILDSANFSANMDNTFALESILLTGEIANPERKPLYFDTMLNDYYFTANLAVDSFKALHLFPLSSPEDTINADVVLSGTYDNPYATVNLKRATVSLQGKPLVATGMFVLEDKIIDIPNAEFSWNSISAENISGSFNIDKWEGKAALDLDMLVMDKTIHAPTSIAVENLDTIKKSGKPENFSTSIKILPISGTFIKNTQNVTVDLLSTQDGIIISTSQNLGVSGTIGKKGSVDIKMKNELPASLVVSGKVDKEQMNLAVSDINVDLSHLFKYFSIPFFNIYEGFVTGGFSIIGPVKSPSFLGQVEVSPVDFNMPDYFTAHAKTKKAVLQMNQSQFVMPVTRCTMKRDLIDVSVVLQMSGLVFERLLVSLQTPNNSWVPIKINLPQLHIKGDVNGNLDIGYEGNVVTVTGDLSAKNTNAELGASRFNEFVTGFTLTDKTTTEVENPIDVEVSLNILAKSRVQVSYSSFLRGVIVPESSLAVNFTSYNNSLVLNGNVPLRSGEITYLNNNFYIKQGEIKFDENSTGFDPRISIEAETRETDDKNNDVKISLSVQNQFLSNLNPTLTASPAKSEKEIMELLGHIVTADSNDVASFMFATGDYALQMMVMRRAENALRDFFNFDIFSLRTMFVQNTLKQGLLRNSNSSSVNRIGNYFDNTAVYIGKYFGNALYADALFRLKYDENRIRDTNTWQGLVFKPEIGLEMDSPLVKIRWSISPDIDQIKENKWVPASALTLSWRFNY